MTPKPLPPRDPGLQGERTSLAWIRTVLTILVNALLVTRAGLVETSPWVTTAGVLLLAVALITMIFGHLRARELIRVHRTEASIFRLTFVFAAALLSTVTAVASIVVT